ncbi:MAG: hypothetical protein MJ177_09345 [Clostridia bacterium]|nr:hypothetical protein [Clostridia bacterium]
MFKTLLKKQMYEFFAGFFIDKKTGKSRAKNGVIGYIVIYIFLFVMLGVVFFNSAATLCAPLSEMGLSWLYFAIMSLIGLALGVFGSVFNTFSALYKAKDNDILLSMPIPPRMILFSRMTGTWIMGTAYELIVMVPALIVYYINVKQTALSVVFSVLAVLDMSVTVLVLSCALGWVVALISGKRKNKSIATVILSLVFLACYYIVYMRAYEYIGMVIQNADKVSSFFKTYIFLIYQLGMAAEGKVLSMLIVTVFTAAAFADVMVVMSRTFIKITTNEKAAAKIVYKEKTASRKSESTALLKKEFAKFFSSPNYMLNCALGTVMMPALGIISLIKGEQLVEKLSTAAPELGNILPLAAAASVCMLTSMNDITAPSVSLEGKSLWIIRSYPVDMKKVLFAKLKVHLIMTVIPGVFASACIGASMKLGIAESVIICLISAAFAVLNGSFGLFINLKKPNFTWTNEIAPIKQSAGVVITLFGGWGVIVVLAALYLLLNTLVSPLIFLIICLAVLSAAAAGFTLWVAKKGSVILNNL